jgi:hypothetical protein
MLALASTFSARFGLPLFIKQFVNFLLATPRAPCCFTSNSRRNSPPCSPGPTRGRRAVGVPTRWCAVGAPNTGAPPSAPPEAEEPRGVALPRSVPLTLSCLEFMSAMFFVDGVVVEVWRCCLNMLAIISWMFSLESNLVDKPKGLSRPRSLGFDSVEPFASLSTKGFVAGTCWRLDLLVSQHQAPVYCCASGRDEEGMSCFLYVYEILKPSSRFN